MNELKLTTALQNGKMVPTGNTPKLPVSRFICNTMNKGIHEMFNLQNELQFTMTFSAKIG